MHQFTRLPFAQAVVLLVGLLSACAYKGGSMENPMANSLLWFSFLAGDDIKRQCHDGAQDWYRLVYNAKFREQVRVYELNAHQDGFLDQRVMGQGNLSVVSLDDLAKPWRGDKASMRLIPEQRDALLAALARDGAFGPPPVGLRLASDTYYWTAVACHEGRFHFTAWGYPSDRFERLTFPEVLRRLDKTGVVFAPARPFGAEDWAYKSPRERDDERWWIEVGSSGLVGVSGR